MTGIRFRNPEVRMSAALAGAATAVRDPAVSLRELLAALGEQGLLVFCGVLAAPFLLPVTVPGMSTVLGLPMLLIGFALGTWLAVRRSEKYGIDKDALTSLAVWAVIMGVLGSRVFWVLQEWGFYSKNPGEIFKITEGGMTSYGGIVFGLLTVVIWCKRTGVRFPVVFDLLAAPALVMHGFGRIGCFLNGCCYGSPCELPWAVTVHPELGPTYLGHPAQIYDTLMAFAGLFMRCSVRATRAKAPGVCR